MRQSEAVLLRVLIGAVLRRVRVEQHRTLRDVAAAAGLSLAHLSEVERGRTEPSSEVLAAICRALGLPIEELLERAGDELALTRDSSGERRLTLVRHGVHRAPRSFLLRRRRDR